MHEDDIHVVDEQTTSAEAAPPDDTVEDATPERTVEAVEAEYRARLSGKDRAHAAEKKALEDRIRELSTADQQRKDGQMDEAAQLRAQLTAAEERAKVAEQQAQQASIEARKARFPHAVEALGDDLVASASEEKLASLENRLKGGAAGDDQPILSNGSARPAGDPVKPTEAKTREELRADLVRFGSGGFDNRE